MFKKILLVLGFFALFFYAGSTPALALDIYWRPAGDDNITYSQRPYTSTNKVDIQVRVDDAKTVEVNGEEAIQIGSSSSELWLLRDYLLKPGNNTIKVKVEKYRFNTRDKKEDTKTGELSITVIDDPLSGSQRHFETLERNLIAFNRSLDLRLPGDTAIVDSTGRATWDQSVTISANTPGFNLSPDYIPISPLYSITAASPSYSISNTGELTLNYDADAGIANNDLITVLYAPSIYQAASLQPPMLQRIGNYKITANSITVPFSQTGFGHYIVVRTTKDFKDFYLKESGGVDLEWARPYVLALWSRGIMGPLTTYPDGSPVPTEFFGLTNKSGQDELPVTRHEFISMLGKGFRLPVSPLSIQSQIFSDMQNLNVTDVQYIQAAVKAGWIPNTPTTDGKLYFHPSNPLTREQACIFMANAAGLQVQTTDQATQMLQANFPNDYASIYSWQRPHVLACIQNNLITSAERGYLRPGKTITRAEAASMVYTILQKNQLL